MMLSTIAEIAQGQSSPADHADVPKAFLAEGGTILKGMEVKETAEGTAESLRSPLKIVLANGLKGVVALAMTYRYIGK